MDQVGVGQLFRFYDILPEFKLVDAGRNPGSFWRLYELNSDKVPLRAQTFSPNQMRRQLYHAGPRVTVLSRSGVRFGKSFARIRSSFTRVKI